MELKPENKAENGGYLGLYISPLDLQDEDKETHKKVYRVVSEIHPMLKKYHKAARFKYCDDYQSALNFAENGGEGDPSWSADALYSEKQAVPILKSISKQEHREFKKHIEDCNVSKVQELVNQNPRYLVGPCAFPCIVKEGPRYNALHVAAKAKSGEIASIILKTVSDPYTYVRLYGQEANDKSNVKSASLLLDLYLNTPDKTLQETPLHFASKHAATNVVEVLISYPECQKDRTNKFDQTPLDIIGSREENVPSSEIEKIRLLLTDPFYVPVLRSEDNLCQPKIGEPFSPTSPVFQHESEDIISPKLEIKAIAGPMAYSQAYMFKKQWKTPPRNFSSPSTSPSTPRSGALFSPSSPALSPGRRIILADLDRGLEKVGRCLAKEKNVGWKEYWSFLKDFADLQSEDGLGKLEAYLKVGFKRKMLSHSWSDSIKTADVSSREGTVGNSDSSSTLPHQNVSQQPYSSSPMSGLCSEFEKLRVKSPEIQAPLGSNKSKSDNDSKGSSLLNGSYGKSFSSSNTVNGPPSSSTNTPYLCVEKSCLVFAKRIGDTLLSNHSNNNSKEPSSENMLKTYLMQEMKHINSLIDNYIDDSAFKDVKFSLLHHRLATRIVSYLMAQPDKLDGVLTDLNQLLDSFSTESLNICGTPPSRSSRFKLQDEEVLHCVTQHCSTILSSFLRRDSGDASLSANCSLTAENEVQSQWELSEPCYCSFVRNSLSPPKRRRMRSFSSNRRSFSSLISLCKKESESRSKFLPGEVPEDRSGSNPSFGFESSESSESEDEWYDPDSTSNETGTTNVVATDQNEDVPMSLPALAPELYIDRFGPCKLDLDVLEAIGDIELDLAKYPLTNFWRFCVVSHPPEEREKWKQRKPDR